MYLKEKDKPFCVGFERNHDHPGQIRFFDKDNRTVFLPDRMYREMRDLILKTRKFSTCNRVELGLYFREEAIKQDLKLRMKRGLRKPVRSIVNAVKRLLNVDNGR